MGIDPPPSGMACMTTGNIQLQQARMGLRMTALDYVANSGGPDLVYPTHTHLYIVLAFSHEVCWIN